MQIRARGIHSFGYHGPNPFVFTPRRGIRIKSHQGIRNSLLCSALQWRHNGGDGVSNHQPHDCLLKRLIRRRSKKTSQLRVTGLCERNSPVTGDFPAQRASNAENISILMTSSWVSTPALLPIFTLLCPFQPLSLSLRPPPISISLCPFLLFDCLSFSVFILHS